MGTVYLAQHCHLGKQVALKLMAPALRSDPEARQRFLLEAKTTAAIKHRHVIEIVDFGDCGGNPYIVMELLDGVDLERYLETRPRLSAQEAASLLLPIVAALASAHDAGVIHRDLKPSNIFLHHEPDGSLVPKLLDFGISKQTLALSGRDFQGTSWNQLLGSPQYLPPEAVNGCRDLTPWSDQYSLGVVLYESVTGRAPIQRKTLFELLTAIARAEFPPPSHGLPELSGHMENAILRCMQQEPSARYKDVRELGRALLELADGRTQLLWGPAFHFESKAHTESEPLACVSRDAPSQPSRPTVAGSGRRLLSWAAVSAGVLAVGGVAPLAAALLAAAPPTPEVDRSFRAARDDVPSSAPPTPAPELPATPLTVADDIEPVLHFIVRAEDASGPDSDGGKSRGVAATRSDAAYAGQATKPPARAKRPIRSPQRPPRRAVAARVRQEAAPSGTAVGDPSPPRGLDVELGEPAPGQRGPPGSQEAGGNAAVGANESPIFD